MRQKIFKHFIDILALNSTQRVWQLPFFIALGVGLVLGVGAYYKRLDLGLISMIGVMAFLYIPNTPMYHRMAVVMCCSFGISLSFLLGLLTHLAPTLMPILVGFVAMASSILVRYYDVGAPGYFFFVFACLLGSFFPFEIQDYIFLTGLVTLGTMVANFIAFIYSLLVIYCFKNSLPKPIPKRGNWGFEVIVVDSVIIGFFVGFAVFLGAFLELERSYWVAVSCTVVMQGISLNGVWIKQIQRILGTALGTLFAWYLLKIEFSTISFVCLMMFLVFMTEFVVTRNYAIAIFFLTPYVTYLAEATSFMNVDANLIALARLQDVIVGSILGLIGGFVIYKPFLRIPFEQISKLVFRKKI
ncbi:MULTISPECIES: FUSC family protein [unclassified Campylobacter]|uniref:FUSC family protein n=1 Tax=unclassified Campylobacter TaxID=2593542 RepID=UPI001237CC1F|nr:MULTISPECIES: FUSC family protein [unclassified Campylobacter]KAA6224704.1 FUSC family protein [Campylobacter sp. LR185c]KAA6225702.1 FUSC family protein [Campylobacter sp. LR286c]KAA6225822.1 FUSC family protein [Campylobacter sp. LR196d]KAA6229675.1 FUSC family protein [Campylobacter sp. LR291e]KAA6230079.1 FUSC family protein [Campylobacter sp. LR264d]